MFSTNQCVNPIKRNYLCTPNRRTYINRYTYRAKPRLWHYKRSRKNDKKYINDASGGGLKQSDYHQSVISGLAKSSYNFYSGWKSLFNNIVLFSLFTVHGEGSKIAQKPSYDI